MEEKWQSAMDKFHRVVRRKEAKEEVKMMKKEEKSKKVPMMDFLPRCIPSLVASSALIAPVIGLIRLL